MIQVNSEVFKKAFIHVWLNQDNSKILEKYSSNKAWTEFMLYKGGFIEQVMNQISSNGTSLTYAREYYTVDALYIGGEDLYSDNMAYPEKVYALIEHENAEDVETEIWKLIHMRSPLKVLIFYDYKDDDKVKNQNKKNWAQDKIDYLINNMLDKVNSFFPENEETEYLFLLGCRESDSSLPYWKWASASEKNFSLLGS